MKKEKQNNKGFTLLEMLVVVLIIGILAGIALPQYEMAVTKAKVAKILPILRRWYDAMAEYKLQHGDYYVIDADALGVSWPSDWKNGYNTNKPCGNSTYCYDDYWHCLNEDAAGLVYCQHRFSSNDSILIMMFQPDDPDVEGLQSAITCAAQGTKGNKVCKALGGKLLEDASIYYGVDNIYALN